MPLFFVACKKESKITNPIINNEPPTEAPGKFTVRIVDREDSYAIIQWTRPASKDTGKITYSVNLKGVTLTANLSDTTFKISNLNDSTDYPGEVVAKNTRGVTITDTFRVSKNLGSVFVSGTASFACYNFDHVTKWSFSLGVASFPVISHDTVFVQGNLINSYDYNIYALNAKTGALYWSAAKVSEGGLGLLYYHGLIYTSFPGSNKIVALNSATGQQVWQFGDAGTTRPTISDGVLLCERSNGLGGVVYALDAKTGTKLWSFPTPGSTSLPVAAHGTTFFQSQGTMYAFDTKTGQQKWSYKYPGGIGGTDERPVIIGETVYFLTYQNIYGPPNTIYAANVNDGSIRWTVVAFSGAEYGNIFGNSDGIYATTLDFTNKYDPLTGKQLWSFPYTATGNNISDIVLIGDKLLNHFQSNSAPFTVYSTLTGVAVDSPLGHIALYGGFVVVYNGVAYYPFYSGMNSSN